MSLHGSNRTNRAGLIMSVVRGGPEVVFPGREEKQSITPQLSLEQTAAELLNQTPARRNGYPVFHTVP